MELKLTYLLFPIFLPTILNGGKIKPKRLLNFVFITAFISFFICLGKAFYHYLTDFNLGHFFSSAFSFIVHPSYLSVVLNMLLTILLYRLVVSNASIKKNGFSLFILSLYITLLASKIGLILLIVNVIYFLGLFLIKRKPNYKIITLFIFVLSLLFTVFIVTPSINQKFSQAYQETFHTDYTNPDNGLSSTGQRIVAWKTTLIIIKHNFWLGVGVGDIRNELTNTYGQLGYEYINQHNLDSHEQFLQTWATIGLLGFLTLVLIFILLFVEAFKTKNSLFLMFALSFFLFALTESMLETQAGILSFFTFLYLLQNKSVINYLKQK